MIFSPTIIALAAIAFAVATGIVCLVVGRSGRSRKRPTGVQVPEESPLDTWRQAGIL